MATFLAYVDAVPGRLDPLVATLIEIAGRGHQVVVKAGIDDIERLRSLGLHAEPLAQPIERFAPAELQGRRSHARDRRHGTRRAVHRRGRVGCRGRRGTLRTALGILTGLGNIADIR